MAWEKKGFVQRYDMLFEFAVQNTTNFLLWAC